MSIAVTSAAFYFAEGYCFRQQQQQLDALLAYHKAWKLAPDRLEYCLTLNSCLAEFLESEEIYASMVYLQQNDAADLACLLGEYYVENHPPCLKVATLLGEIFFNGKTYGQAAQYYQKAAELCQDDPVLQHNIGVCLQRDNRHQEAIVYLNRAIASCPEWVSARKTLAACFIHTEAFLEAIAQLEWVCAIEPNDEIAMQFLAGIYADQGVTEEALAYYNQLECLAPNNYKNLLRSRLLLPIIYKTSDEIEVWYDRFGLGLRQLSDIVDSGDASVIHGIYEAIKNDISTFLIAYQGRNCRDYMQMYGQLINNLLATCCPDIAKGVIPTVVRNSKIQIGLITSRTDGHPLSRWLQGWLKNRNKDDFTLHLYFGPHTGPTSELKSQVDHWTVLPNDLEGAAQNIRQDQLDILVFSDIGMIPWLTLLAGLRLAPVQCTCWAGHPVTTGLLTMDYFLSSELQEPVGAEEHYSEELVRLPGIGVVCTQPPLPETPHPRSYYGIADQDIVYLCVQSLYKYLPQDDHVFVEIARRVPSARFFFVDLPMRKATERFLDRMQLVFEDAGLSFEHYVKMFSRKNQKLWIDYISLPMNSDIYLDSIGWSGGLTTMDAVACGLPIVTTPTELMRGRHSFGILKHIGVTDTIGANKTEYVEIAVRLGLDTHWRAEIVQKMKMNGSHLFEDVTCIAKMEDFFRTVASKR